MTFSHVDFAYEETPVLRDFSLTLPERGIICLFGPSGCGKTTLLRLMAGLEKPQAGTLSGQDGKRITAVFQEDRLLRWMTAAENVALVLPGKDTARKREEALKWLGLVGLEKEADALPTSLSGGMKRRVAIARALAAQGDLLMLDEPFTGLDDARRTPIADYIRQAYADRLVVLVTHNEEEWKMLGARRLLLHETPLCGEFTLSPS